MKRVFNKQVVLAIGVMALSAFVCVKGTMAWLTAQVSVSQLAFEAATVKLEMASEPPAVRVFQFKSGHADVIHAQKELASCMSENYSDSEKALLLEKWWEDYKDSMKGDNPILFIESEFLLGTEGEHYVSPGDLIRASYQFANESTTPVYFRIKMAAGGREPSSGSPIVQTASISGKPDSGASPLRLASDGYYYGLEPVWPGEDMEVIVTGYIGLDGENGGVDLGFAWGLESAEVIQAREGLVDSGHGWSDAAAELDFVPVNSGD